MTAAFDGVRDRCQSHRWFGYPFNVMHWVRNPDAAAPVDDSLSSFEVLDGQQRTLSICKYVNGDFSINEQYFHNLTDACGNGQVLVQALPEPPKSANSGTCRTSPTMDLQSC